MFCIQSVSTYIIPNLKQTEKCQHGLRTVVHSRQSEQLCGVACIFHQHCLTNREVPNRSAGLCPWPLAAALSCVYFPLTQCTLSSGILSTLQHLYWIFTAWESGISADSAVDRRWWLTSLAVLYLGFISPKIASTHTYTLTHRYSMDTNICIYIREPAQRCHPTSQNIE